MALRHHCSVCESLDLLPIAMAKKRVGGLTFRSPTLRSKHSWSAFVKNLPPVPPLAPRKRPAAALSNKTLVARYDALVQRVKDRVAAAPSSALRFVLLALITRLNGRGMRELERRQRASEEQSLQELLFPANPRRGRWP